MKLESAHLDMEYQQLGEALRRRMEKPGHRMSLRTAILLVAAVAFVLGLLLLSQQGTLAEQQKLLNRMNKSIEECGATNDLLAEQITEASDASVICYAAVRDLHMIPGEAAEAIHLVAMDTRPMDAQPQYALGTGTDSAGNPQQQPVPETTMIPAVASAGLTQ
jgi:cell division protein FtsL